MDRQNVEPEGTLVQLGEAPQLDAFGQHSAPPEPKPAINPFARLWSMGYRRLVPIVPPLAELSPTSSMAKRPACRGKAVGICGPSGKFYGFNWHQHETVEVDLERWCAMGAGVGTKTGQGLVAIDIDSLDHDLAALACATALEILGPAPRRIGRAPKVLLPYRVSEITGYRRVSFSAPSGKTEMVEMLGEGRQFVMGGIHPGTMEPYRWPDGVKAYADLTLVSHAQIDAFFERLVEIMPEAKTQATATGKHNNADVDQNSLRGEIRDVRAALSAIPNDCSDREFFIRVCAATKASLPDDPEEALTLAWDWASQYVHTDGSPKSYDSFMSDWNGIRAPFRIGAQYLYDKASAAAGENMTPFEKHFDVVPEGSVDTSAFSGPSAAPKKPALAFVGLGEWAGGALTTRARPLIKGLLDQGAMTVLYGESNVGKTFVALDMAFHIAMGLPWGGMKTTQKRVAYIAAEGGQGARKRGAALIAKYGACDDFQILPKSVDLLRADADVQPLIEALKELGDNLGLVVIDTLSRAMAGGNENDSTDMGAVVRHLDAIRNATGAHVLVVHHSGKDKTRGARGHSLLRAATDTEIEVSEGQIDVTKQRDLEKSYASAFELDVVTLGADEDGDLVTSCTLRLVSKQADITPGIATPKESQILQGLNAWADTFSDPRAGVLQADFLTFLGKPKSEAENVRGHLKSLRAKNLVERVGRGRWRTTCRSQLDENAFFEVQQAEKPPVRSGGSPSGVGVFQ